MDDLWISCGCFLPELLTSKRHSCPCMMTLGRGTTDIQEPPCAMSLTPHGEVWHPSREPWSLEDKGLT